MIEIKNPIQFMQVLPEVLKKGGAIVHRPTTPLVHLGLDNDINKDYCTANNIPIFRVQRTGGAIVSNVGDFEFVVVNSITNIKKVPLLFEKLTHLLISKNVHTELQNNDLLCEGYKVGSWSYRNLDNNMIYTAMHLSMSINMESIKNICKKEMKKVPKGLNDFGVTEQEILKILEELK